MEAIIKKNDTDFYYLNELIETVKNNLDTIDIGTITAFSDANWILPVAQWHDFEILYFIKGGTRLTVGEYNHTAKSGDVFFTDNSQPNACESGSYTYLSICFYVKDYNGANKNLYGKIGDCFKNLSRKHPCRKREYMEEYFFEMIKESLVKQPGYELNIKLSLLRILIEILRLSASAKEDVIYKYVKYSGMVSDIITFLSENLQKNYTLAELGEKYRFNPRYLNRIFRNVTSFPVFQYLQHLRVDKAKKLLKSSSLSILDIAHEAGFESSQCLDRAFKKITGLTPGEYRKMIV